MPFQPENADRLPADQARGSAPASRADAEHGEPSSRSQWKGYRARPAREITQILEVLSEGVASRAAEAIRKAGEKGEPPAAPSLFVAAIPAAGWYPWLAGALMQVSSGGQSPPPVRGTTDIAAAIGALAPMAQTAVPVVQNLMQQIRAAASPRMPILAPADLAGLWISVLLKEMCGEQSAGGGWNVRILGAAGTRADSQRDCILIAELVSATVLWRSRRPGYRKRDRALAQWFVIRADGVVLGGGTVDARGGPAGWR